MALKCWRRTWGSGTETAVVGEGDGVGGGQVPVGGCSVAVQVLLAESPGPKPTRALSTPRHSRQPVCVCVEGEIVDWWYFLLPITVKS